MNQSATPHSSPKLAPNTFSSRRLGDIIQNLYNIPRSQIESAAEAQNHTHAKLGQILLQRKIISEDQLSASLALLLPREMTFLSHAFFSPLKVHFWGRHLQLAVESCLVTLLTIAIVYNALNLAESGIIVISLLSATLTVRCNAVLADTNAKNEALNLLALFVGILTAFAAFTVFAPIADIQKAFGFLLEIAQIDPTSTLANRQFGDFRSLLAHNGFVFIIAFVLSFVYRSYATLLILSWNACIWSVTLTLLLMHGAHLSHGSGTAPLAHIGYGLLATLPHLLFEATAYIGISITAIGISKSSLWHPSLNRRLRHSLLRLGLVALVSSGLLITGAFVESRWAPFMVAQSQRTQLP